MNTFVSSDYHPDAMPQDLSEHWGISIPDATKILKKTMQQFMHISVLTLARRYMMNQVLTRKNLLEE